MIKALSDGCLFYCDVAIGKEVYMPESNFEREVLDRLTKIEVKLDSYEKLKETTYQNQRDILQIMERNEQQQEQINELRDRNKWLARTIGASLIGIIIASICFAIKLGAM